MVNLKISRYCHIKDNKVFIDGKLIFEDRDVAGLKPFSKSLYRFLAPSYNKFFKMDEISRLGFLAAEVLLRDFDLSGYNPDEISVILSNSESTLITDQNHQITINDFDNFFPSPSVFVYTLPNIMIGEISIRHKFRGENAFFIVENFSADLIANHINNLFLTNKSKVFVGGWANQSNDNYEAFGYLASDKGHLQHNALEIKSLYNNKIEY
ncbi:MAG: 3-oxoacyl-ACP synthase [Bacteroidetes bacterium]|nr:3-oxoacyl-ACP synthase [Bacteroidota bacterium]